MAIKNFTQLKIIRPNFGESSNFLEKTTFTFAGRAWSFIHRLLKRP
jgi:hypothetical protein